MIEKIYDAIIDRGNKVLGELYEIAPAAIDYSNRLLLRLLRENKDTVYGRQYGFEHIVSYEQYKQQVPLTDYADYQSLVERISQNGEQNVLTAAPVVHFCPTTGTTSAPKLIPTVEESLRLSTDYTLPACFAIMDKTLREEGKTDALRGKGVFLLEIGKLSASPSGIPIGGISGTSVRASDGIVEVIASSPREVITHEEYLDSNYIQAVFALRETGIRWMGACYITSVAGFLDCIEKRWRDMCDDIEAGAIRDDVKMPEEVRARLNEKLTPDPQRADELRAIFRAGFDEPILLKLWPRLCMIAAIGSGGFKMHKEKVRRFSGDDVHFCNLVISSSESIVAVADGCDSEDFILIPQAAFFEFIPENDPQDIKSVGELKVGERYEVVVTTVSGLYRYRLYDVVEVTGFVGQLPKLRFSHRANVFLNIAGEKTTEADMLRAIRYFTEKTGIKVAEYCAFTDLTVEPGCYTVLLEPDGEIDKSKLKEYEDILEEGFCVTFGYKYERLVGNICPVKLILQQPETHAFYRELQIMKGRSLNQLKPVRLLKDPGTKAFFMEMTE